MGAARLLCCLALLAAALYCPAQAQQPQAVPALSAPVNDPGGRLSARQRSELDATLRAFEQRKGSQIAVLIVASTAPETIEQYALRVAEQWKLGRARIDDGAILVVAVDERRLRIEVGYGLEGVLNDATAKRIIDEVIVPQLRNNALGDGIAAGLAAMIKVIDGEALPPRRAAAEAGTAQWLPLAMFATVALGAVLRAILGRLPGAAITGAIVGALVWLMAGTVLLGLSAAVLAFLLTVSGASRMAGMYLGQGRGGGAWSGGGGGGFGGGGASGRW